MRHTPTILAAFALSFSFASTTFAAPINIVSLAYVHPVPAVDCESTIPNEPPGSECAPIGVTLTGALNNPFLNDLNTKAIDLPFGSYYTFGNPYPPTDFMVEGDSIVAFLKLSDGTTLNSPVILVPNLSIAGTTMFDFPAYGITIVTTGILNADRVSFGLPPPAFAPDGNLDYVLQLNYTGPAAAPVPEPGSAILLLTALPAAALAARRHARRRQDRHS